MRWVLCLRLWRTSRILKYSELNMPLLKRNSCNRKSFLFWEIEFLIGIQYLRAGTRIRMCDCSTLLMTILTIYLKPFTSRLKRKMEPLLIGSWPNCVTYPILISSLSLVLIITSTEFRISSLVYRPPLLILFSQFRPLCEPCLFRVV